MDELSSSGGFGLSGADESKKAPPSAPQASDFLNGSLGGGAKEESKDEQGVADNASIENRESQKAGVSEGALEKWASEEGIKKRRQDYLEERIRISISKYLGDETINEYVTRIDDVDRIGAENEAKIWKMELEERITPMFVGVRNSFSRDMVADAAQAYFRDNVPIVSQIISEIRTRDRNSAKDAPREIYLDLLRKFLSAYFNENFSKSFAEIKRMTGSETASFLSRLRVRLEDEFMKDFDRVKFNSFDEDAVFRKTEDAVLEELKK